MHPEDAFLSLGLHLFGLVHFDNQVEMLGDLFFGESTVHLEIVQRQEGGLHLLGVFLVNHCVHDVIRVGLVEGLLLYGRVVLLDVSVLLHARGLQVEQGVKVFPDHCFHQTTRVFSLVQTLQRRLSVVAHRGDEIFEVLYQLGH